MWEITNPDWSKEIPECRQCWFPKDLCTCNLDPLKDGVEIQRRWKIKWNREHQYPVISPEYRQRKKWVNPFFFNRYLSKFFEDMENDCY